MVKGLSWDVSLSQGSTQTMCADCRRKRLHVRIPKQYAVVASLIALSLVAVWILRDAPARIAITADDAFYVTIPAENFVNHGYPSLDGANPTNGFHPLIFFLDVFFAWIGVKDICLLNQILGLILLIVSCFAIQKYACRFVDESSSWLLALAFVFTPHVFAASLSGLEAPFYILALIVYYGYLRTYISSLRSTKSACVMDSLRLGFLAVVAYLCRTEFLVHLAIQVISGAFLLMIIKRLRPDRAPRISARCVLALVLPTIVVFSLYGFFGLRVTGHFLQSSASQKSVLHALFKDGIHAFRPAGYFQAFSFHGFLPCVMMVLPLAFLSMDRRRRTDNAYGLITLMSFVGLHAFYALLIPTYQWHYMASFVTLAYLVLPPWLSGAKVRDFGVPIVGILLIATFFVWDLKLLQDSLLLRIEFAFAGSYVLAFVLAFGVESLMKRHAISLLVASVISFVGLMSMIDDFRSPHVRRVHISESLNKVLASDVVVGAGPSGFYAEHLRNPVVNLDGAISWPALEYLREGRIDDYIRDHNIMVILEFEPPPMSGFIEVAPGVHVRDNMHELAAVLKKAFAGQSGNRSASATLEK